MIAEKASLSLKYINPNQIIHHFAGTISKGSDSSELEIRNFIPRGTFLKNSDDVYALVVYTGQETKVSLNLGKYQFKIGSLQKLLNKFIAINIVMWAVWIIFMSQIMNRVWTSNKVSEKHTYLFYVGDGKNNINSYTE